MPPSETPVASASGTCPRTRPNGPVPPGRKADGGNYGNGRMWTALWPHGVVVAIPDYVNRDGSVGMKWPWWWKKRLGSDLVITGRRLDAAAPPLTGDVLGGYEAGFQPSGITFPTPGCWEVTGRVGGAQLTFVTLVRLSATRPDS